MADDTRSPIKDKPLRHPGQSIEEEREKLVEDQLQPYLMYAAFLSSVAMLEWWRWYMDLKPSPYLFTGVAAVSLAIAVWRFYRLKPRMRALRLGLEGEKVVGQYLERLRAEGYVVFHDVVAPGFNVDHVLIGPAGVFTVETKTWSKPVHGNARIQFDGERLVAAGHTSDRNPIVQAKAQATWLRHLLNESTGRKLEVFPIILIPGWYIEQSDGSLRDVWVLEPKALPGFLSAAPARLDKGEVSLAAFHLSRFIRGRERERTG